MSTTEVPSKTCSDEAKVFVLSGPTAVGKGTVVKALKAADPDIFVSISATTRKPRPGENDGVDYYFVSDHQFDDLIADNGLLEYATVHNASRYGTPRRPVEQAVEDGKVALLEIDLDGARQVKRTMPQAIQIFLAPPSWDELVRRLQGRGTESPQEQQRRLATAKVELAAQSEFDYVIVNNTVEQSVENLLKLISL